MYYSCAGACIMSNFKSQLFSAAARGDYSLKSWLEKKFNREACQGFCRDINVTDKKADSDANADEATSPITRQVAPPRSPSCSHEAPKKDKGQPDLESTDYYEILGLQRDAIQTDIRRAYVHTAVSMLL